MTRSLLFSGVTVLTFGLSRGKTVGWYVHRRLHRV
jgi:hypothetical protein